MRTLHFRRPCDRARCSACPERSRGDTYPRQPGLSITHYAFDLTLTDASSEITVTEVVDLRFTTSGVTSLDLDLCDVDAARTPSAVVDPCVGARGGAGRAGGATASPGGGGLSGSANQTATPVGMTVTSVVADGAPVPFTHQKDRLHITLPHAVAGERGVDVHRRAITARRRPACRSATTATATGASSATTGLTSHATGWRRSITRR